MSAIEDNESDSARTASTCQCQRSGTPFTTPRISHVEDLISEFSYLLKEQISVCHQIPDGFVITKASSTAEIKTHLTEPVASISRLGEPHRGTWGSLASFLMYSISLWAQQQHRENDIEYAKEFFSSQAMYICVSIVRKLQAFSDLFHADPSILKEVVETWPFRLLLYGKFPLEFSFQKEAYMHLFNLDQKEANSSEAIWYLHRSRHLAINDLNYGT